MHGQDRLGGGLESAVQERAHPEQQTSLAGCPNKLEQSRHREMTASRRLSCCHLCCRPGAPTLPPTLHSAHGLSRCYMQRAVCMRVVLRTGRPCTARRPAAAPPRSEAPRLRGWRPAPPGRGPAASSHHPSCCSGGGLLGRQANNLLRGPLNLLRRGGGGGGSRLGGVVAMHLRLKREELKK